MSLILKFYKIPNKIPRITYLVLKITFLWLVNEKLKMVEHHLSFCTGERFLPTLVPLVRVELHSF